MASVERLLPGTDHRAIKEGIEALNHATEDFAARRMDEGIKRALAGRKIGVLSCRLKVLPGHVLARREPRSRRGAGSRSATRCSNGVEIEHACEKQAACTTCHVILRQGYDSLEARKKRKRISSTRPGAWKPPPGFPGQDHRPGPRHRDPQVHHQLRARGGQEVRWTDTRNRNRAVRRASRQGSRAVNFVDLYKWVMALPGVRRRSQALRGENSQRPSSKPGLRKPNDLERPLTGGEGAAPDAGVTLEFGAILARNRPVAVVLRRVEATRAGCAGGAEGVTTVVVGARV